MVNIEEDYSSDEVLELPKPMPSGVKFSEPIVEKKRRLSTSLDRLKSNFVEMGFSPNLVDKVIDEKGEENADVLLETLISHTETNEATLSERMKKQRFLKEMGFTEDEISHAIDSFGYNVPINELADAIFANQIARADATEDQKEQLRGSDQVTDDHYVRSSSSGPSIYDSTDLRKKRPKQAVPKPNQRPKKRSIIDEVTGRDQPPYSGLNESEGSSYEVYRSILPSKPPYLFFAVIGEISRASWTKISEFLYRIDPEYADAQCFSAISRKEGYIHNLPMTKRVHVEPKAPMTIEAALPHTTKWWPFWDTRRKLSCIVSEPSEASPQCQKLEEIMKSSQGMLNNSEKAVILHSCKAMNLVWTGQHKLSPLDPEDIECILGYPKKHTNIPGISLDNRLRALTNCFQIDMLAYHLSVLKSLYPGGIKVLSVFSGIGGAELAFHKLGIPLLCVVSIEPLKSNQDIMRWWWQKSGQAGDLIQVDNIEEMTTKKLDRIVKDIGGFDIVIGSNPCLQPANTANHNGSAGVNFPLFFEFVRMYNQLKTILIK